MRQEIIEVNGQRYMSANAAAKLWSISPRTVRGYCQNEKVPGAFKDMSKRWCIPIEAYKPLSDEEIRKILMLTVYLQNNPKQPVNEDVSEADPASLTNLYEYLRRLDYIRKPKHTTGQEFNLPRNVQLTDKGLELIDHTQKVKKLSAADYINLIASLVSITNHIFA